METQRKIMARGDRLSDLPESILIHILSMLPESKEVVRTSILSMQWRFLWMSVPLSLHFEFPNPFCSHTEILDLMASFNRELHYWRSGKIRTFKVRPSVYRNQYAKDFDLWVYFATKVANVEEFTLRFSCVNGHTYEFPQFAYKNTSLRNLVLSNCELNPSGSVSWSNLVSLSIRSLKLTDGFLEKVLSGCPNLECLELHRFSGIHRLEITSVKLRELIIEGYMNENHALWLEIFAPHIQSLQLLGFCSEICTRKQNVASLVTAVISLRFSFEDDEQKLEKECSYLKELLHSVAHVENLELDTWCIECLSILELKGWQSPPSSRKFLKLNAALEELYLPGVCSFLQSSSHLETLVIDWYYQGSRDLLSVYTDEDEQIKRFKTHNFNCSFPHLKTIKIVNFNGPPGENELLLPLVKYLLKNATVLEKFVITAGFSWSYFRQDYVEMEREFPSLPRSSLHTSFVFS